MKSKGQNITEFALILALVVIACVIILTLLGGNVSKLFGVSEKKYKEFDPFKFASNNTSPNGGSLGGTPGAPKMQCVNGLCTIDYGDLVLTGIPENFSDYVNSNGTSGGTEATSLLFDQIAQQQLSKGDKKGYADFKLLANIGHFQAQYQKAIENLANGCQSDVNPSKCMSTKLKSMTPASLNLTLPTDLSSILPNYNSISNTKYFDNSYELNQRIADIGFARFRTDIQPQYASPSDSKTYPSFAALEKLDQIMANPKYSDNLKNITMTLLQNNQNITIDQMNVANSNISAETLRGIQIPKFDLLTGVKSLVGFPSGKPDMNAYLHPQTSQTTNLNSSLVCVAGKNLTDGKSCYN